MAINPKKPRDSNIPGAEQTRNSPNGETSLPIRYQAEKCQDEGDSPILQPQSHPALGLPDEEETVEPRREVSTKLGGTTLSR